MYLKQIAPSNKKVTVFRARLRRDGKSDTKNVKDENVEPRVRKFIAARIIRVM